MGSLQSKDSPCGIKIEECETCYPLSSKEADFISSRSTQGSWCLVSLKVESSLQRRSNGRISLCGLGCFLSLLWQLWTLSWAWKILLASRHTNSHWSTQSHYSWSVSHLDLANIPPPLNSFWEREAVSSHSTFQDILQLSFRHVYCSWYLEHFSSILHCSVLFFCQWISYSKIWLFLHPRCWNLGVKIEYLMVYWSYQQPLLLKAPRYKQLSLLRYLIWWSSLHIIRIFLIINYFMN